MTTLTRTPLDLAEAPARIPAEDQGIHAPGASRAPVADAEGDDHVHGQLPGPRGPELRDPEAEEEQSGRVPGQTGGGTGDQQKSQPGLGQGLDGAGDPGVGRGEPLDGLPDPGSGSLGDVEVDDSLVARGAVGALVEVF